MILKAYYSGGRIDVFDTDQLADCVPQSNNLLTNYTLDLAGVNGENLWLRSYCYEAAQAYKDEMAPKDLSVARRRDGWRFLIADAEDLQRLNQAMSISPSDTIRTKRMSIERRRLWFAEPHRSPQSLDLAKTPRCQPKLTDFQPWLVDETALFPLNRIAFVLASKERTYV